MGQGESQICTHDPTSNKDVCLNSENAQRLFDRSDIATNARQIAANTADIATLKSKLERGTPSSIDCAAAFAGKTIQQWQSLNARTFKNYVNSLGSDQWAKLDEHIAVCGPANLGLNTFQRNCAKRQNGCKPATQ